MRPSHRTCSNSQNALAGGSVHPFEVDDIEKFLLFVKMYIQTSLPTLRHVHPSILEATLRYVNFLLYDKITESGLLKEMIMEAECRQ